MSVLRIDVYDFSQAAENAL